MDPNATLQELLELRDEVNYEWDQAENEQAAPRDREIRFAELVDALDGWLSGGGFLPRKWQAGRK